MSEPFLDEFLEGTKTDTGSDNPVKEKVIEQLKTIYDPEIPVNIYELGLIYGVELDENGRADVTMTLTTPMCPVAESLPQEVQDKVESVEGVTEAHVELVWEPAWDMSMLSEAAKLELGML